MEINEAQHVEFVCETCKEPWPSREDERSCFYSHKKEQHKHEQPAKEQRMTEQPAQQETLPATQSSGGLPQTVSQAIAPRMPHLYPMLPPDVKHEAFRASTIIALQELNQSKLQEVSPESVLKALTKAAMKGWLPSSPDCHFVILKGKLECWDGYPGLQKELARSSFVRDSFAETVFMRDTFEIDLLKDQLSHKPYLDGDRGAKRGVYACVVFRDGTRRVKYMSTGEILEAVRGITSASNAGSAWSTHPDSMEKALVLRRLARSVVQIKDNEPWDGDEDTTALLPMSPERRDAAIADMYGDDRVDTGARG